MFTSRSCFVIVLHLRHLQFLLIWDVVLHPSCVLGQLDPSVSRKIPMPCDNKDDIEYVKRNHGNALPQAKTSVRQKDETEAGGDCKEANIANKAPPGDLERFDDSHTTSNNRCDKSGGTDQFSNSQTATVSAHSSKRGEDIGTAISEGEEGDPSEGLAHAQYGGDRAEIDA